MAPTAEFRERQTGHPPPLSRGDGPNRLGDSIGHVIADLLAHRSERTRPADVLDDEHEWIREPRDHGRLASRGSKRPLPYWTPAC